MAMHDIDHAANLFRQSVDLMNAATDLNSLTVARTTLISAVVALLDAAHQGAVLLTHLNAEIDQVTVS
jgi:hypothetical protein